MSKHKYIAEHSVHQATRYGPKRGDGTRDRYLYPGITLAGKWMDACGFKKGQRLRVEANECSITISVMAEDEPDIPRPPTKAEVQKRERAEARELKRLQKEAAKVEPTVETTIEATTEETTVELDQTEAIG